MDSIRNKVMSNYELAFAAHSSNINRFTQYRCNVGRWKRQRLNHALSVVKSLLV
ncbi:hypothetical protein VCR4J5_200262 [Vibrio crassostreae]|uniref:Uncharacterized protein n=1 Tax=Vibrio crassostreae TaxID=246167 RepID=A0A822MWT1_9VIBR|nr:hypothetical protein VCR9J2_1350195 [Vibrio crassostreae]CDT34701.1 hypothetical protein VCR4J5_200262 [Vibrio crassostreae]CDT40950.1 hypothetical protein VCR5J5_290089 [Vibrio crassostreae]CDT50412.1 hypothetical protein VCR19J5_560211 [Vibrio crassostreae]